MPNPQSPIPQLQNPASPKRNRVLFDFINVIPVQLAELASNNSAIASRSAWL